MFVCGRSHRRGRRLREGRPSGVESTSSRRRKPRRRPIRITRRSTKFRQDRENNLKGNAGWLTIAGLWFLTQPQTTFGSDPLNDIVFPASAPPRAGTFDVRNGKVTVTAASGVTFQLDGKPVTTVRGEVRRPGSGRPPVAWKGPAVLGAQQRRSSVDSPARSEQRAAEGVRRLELVSHRSGVSRRGHATRPIDKPKIGGRRRRLVGDSDKTPIPGS